MSEQLAGMCPHRLYPLIQRCADCELAEALRERDEAREVARRFLDWLRHEYPDHMQEQFEEAIREYPWLKEQEE